MRTALVRLVAAAAVLAGALPAGAAPPGADCPLFPADNAWHADVSRLPVHPRSAAWITSMGGPGRRLHPDFGPAGPGEQPYGIPYAVVDGSKAKVPVSFEYDDESDAGPYPFGSDTPIEGGSDRHAQMVDRDTCTLYELYAVEWNNGAPTAGSGAIWDLRSHALRPSGWTSADAAGLPILPGLLRKDEVAAGLVDHAMRVTASRTDRSFVWPARHQAGAARDPNLPPMGARFRLRGDFDLSPFREDSRVVLRAMQRHGMIVADNGSDWYFTGTSEEGWDTALLDELKRVPAGAFEAVDASSLMADPESGQVAVAAPTPATTSTTAAPTTTTMPAPPPTTATTRPPAKPTTTSAPATTAPPTTASTAPETTMTTTAPPPAHGVAPPSTPLAAAPGSGNDKTPLWFAVGFAVAGALGVVAFRYRPWRRTP
ncbi:MAG TPA: hypothetical protein VGL92_01200 [Acidimicrobiia bacterium]|jgi:hypothetical protein